MIRARRRRGLAVAAEVVRVLDQLEGGEHAGLHLARREVQPVAAGSADVMGVPRLPGAPATTAPWGTMVPPLSAGSNPLRDQLVPMCHE